MPVTQALVFLRQLMKFESNFNFICWFLLVLEEAAGISCDVRDTQGVMYGIKQTLNRVACELFQFCYFKSQFPHASMNDYYRFHTVRKSQERKYAFKGSQDKSWNVRKFCWSFKKVRNKSGNFISQVNSVPINCRVISMSNFIYWVWNASMQSGMWTRNL